MRSALFICGVIAAVACGPIDQSGGSPSVGSDGGTSSPAGGSDGGTVAAPGGGSSDGGTATAAACDGVAPASLAAPQTATVAHKNGDVCQFFTSDRAGDVAAESHHGNSAFNWQIWSAAGAAQGSFTGVAGDVFGQDTGFESIQHANANSLIFFDANGHAVRSTPLDQGGCTSVAFPSAVSGSVVVDNCGGTVTLTRFDAQANTSASTRVGAVPNVTAVVDAKGQTLVVVSPGSAVGVSSGLAARWFDAQLAPLTPFFAAPGGGGAVALRPLASGGAALQVGGAWVGTSQSGAASFDAAPDWLTSHANYDLQVIRGGSGYALIPRAGAAPHDALDFVAATGESCGRVTFPTAGLSIGPDGTVIGSSGPDGCSMSWWPGLLK
ncbi:MAG TPA: hypothetical protein VGH20_15470 [Myxococcales bacterium]|jgi:hypothetical protein